MYFWHDHWVNISITPSELQRLAVSHPVDYSLLTDWILVDNWDLDKLRLELAYQVGTIIFQTCAVNLELQAKPIWKPSPNGCFSTKSARLLVRNCKTPTDWFESFWSPYLSATISIFCWKISQG